MQSWENKLSNYVNYGTWNCSQAAHIAASFNLHFLLKQQSENWESVVILNDIKAVSGWTWSLGKSWTLIRPTISNKPSVWKITFVIFIHFQALSRWNFSNAIHSIDNSPWLCFQSFIFLMIHGTFVLKVSFQLSIYKLSNCTSKSSRYWTKLCNLKKKPKNSLRSHFFSPTKLESNTKLCSINIETAFRQTFKPFRRHHRLCNDAQAKRI